MSKLLFLWKIEWHLWLSYSNIYIHGFLVVMSYINILWTLSDLNTFIYSCEISLMTLSQHGANRVTLILLQASKICMQNKSGTLTITTPSEARWTDSYWHKGGSVAVGECPFRVHNAHLSDWTLPLQKQAPETLLSQWNWSQRCTSCLKAALLRGAHCCTVHSRTAAEPPTPRMLAGCWIRLFLPSPGHGGALVRGCTSGRSWFIHCNPMHSTQVAGLHSDLPKNKVKVSPSTAAALAPGTSAWIILILI